MRNRRVRGRRHPSRFAHAKSSDSIRRSDLDRFRQKSDSLGQLQSPATKFTASTRESPQNATFLIALNQSGSVRYCFPQNSSGDSPLDEQARAYLFALPIRAGEESSHDEVR